MKFIKEPTTSTLPYTPRDEKTKMAAIALHGACVEQRFYKLFHNYFKKLVLCLTIFKHIQFFRPSFSADS